MDLRPPEAFADYRLPGARNADIAEVMANPAYLAGSIPLILVDRDGSLAMAVGGILSQKTRRPIKVSVWRAGRLLDGFGSEKSGPGSPRGRSPHRESDSAGSPGAISPHRPSSYADTNEKEIGGVLR